ncbi:MAG: heme-binding protein [Deltaproteobacteria bacterium]|nr:heme-binding protein [Deltaproteobacteria bacterium]
MAIPVSDIITPVVGNQISISNQVIFRDLGKKRYEKHATKLMDWIATKGWKMTGAPVWARYNPPFMPWFMRRNEILIPVQSQ